MRINKCYHADGREMEKDYKIKPTDKIAEELLNFLAQTVSNAQNDEQYDKNTA
ncbi:MAG: hypothetical protein HFE79_09500 [Ruminiclostridium sp.]|nr:hypothetical protein [Ruminiclostridium sp.]